MEMYVLKNEDGTQSVSEIKNISDNVVGLWKLKSVKYKFFYNIILPKYDENELKNDENKPFEFTKIGSKTYNLTCIFNTILRKKRLKIENNKNYLFILNYLKLIAKKNDYVTTHSLLKHFNTTSTPIDKQVLLDMVKLSLISKSYHKVKVTKKGFEYILNY
jgi:hypothetical protein